MVFCFYHLHASRGNNKDVSMSWVQLVYHISAAMPVIKWFHKAFIKSTTCNRIMAYKTFSTFRSQLLCSLLIVICSAKKVVSSGSDTISFAAAVVRFSCSSVDPPIWNRIKSAFHVQSLAVGDRRKTRFNDQR